MSYENVLIAEVHSILDRLSTNSDAWHASWIAHAICNDHKDGLSDDGDTEFWRHCTYAKVRDTVRRCINKRAGDNIESEERQATLPGFEHLHAYYVVKRGEEEVGLPVHDLTDDEIEGKAGLYRRMGATCFAHADELDRYKRRRHQHSLVPLLDDTPSMEHQAS